MQGDDEDNDRASGPSGGACRKRTPNGSGNCGGGGREQNRQLVLDFLRTPSLPDLIFDALYDYLELLEVPYDQLFACQCQHLNEENADFVICIYDNACKWLEYLLLRFPALHQAVHGCIDPTSVRNSS